MKNFIAALLQMSAGVPWQMLLPSVQDLLIFGGIGMAGYGAWCIFAPAGWLLAGVGLFYIGARR